MTPVAICFLYLNAKFVLFYGPFVYSKETTWSSAYNVLRTA